jgi:hypothetical protein
MEQSCQSCLYNDSCSYVLMNGTNVCSEYVPLVENKKESDKLVAPYIWGD